MKRVREFELRTAPLDYRLDEHARDWPKLQPQAFSSWHKMLAAFREQATESASPIQAFASARKCKEVLASLSPVDRQALQAPTSNASKVGEHSEPVELPASEIAKALKAGQLWESAPFAEIHGQQFFNNRNMAGYHWMLLEGAHYEVPFRLGFLERKAQRWPTGPSAFVLSLLGEYHDMFGQRLKSL